MKNMLLLKTRVFLGAFIGLVFAALTCSGALDALEDLTVDYRLRLRKPQTVSDEVRLVGIGDRDVESFGRWPIERSIHGKMLEILRATGVKHTTFDVVFSEPSADVQQDAELKAAIEKQPDVTLAYHFEEAKPDKPVTEEEQAHFIAKEDAGQYGLDVNALSFVRGRMPVPPFAKLPVGYGAVNVVPDADGVIRRVPLLFAHQGKLYPSLAMQTIIAALGLEQGAISVVPGKEITLVNTPHGTLRIPIDEQGQYRINFLGDLDVFTPAFDYSDLYLAVESDDAAHREQVAAALKNRIALVGIASTGNTDMATTSIGRVPGVAVQATVVSNILTGSHLCFLPRWQQTLQIVLAGVLLGLGMGSARTWLGIVVFLLITAAWGAATVLAANTNVILPVVPVFGTFGLATLVMLGLEAAAIKQDRSRVVDVLGRYIARPVLERLVDTEHTAPAATERRELTIFFSDIRGFTAWTERAEPDEVAARLNEYFAAMTPFIERHGGTLDKFIGDCIMVFFGAPAADDKHALHAVQMALDMQREMTRLNENWSKRGYEPLHIGIGIHTAYVTVGSFGSSTFLDYTVIGRGVNLAARIESQAEGGKILISARTHSLVRDQIKSQPHPDLTLKGIPEPQVVWEVVNT